ncbi:hypothetical protein VNO77_01836 [Canavalia gladiata]|uniref:Uncharacterized protein n=1 Tax=Canavalia gladiata TaxID=3824 RepID=A0AAN9R5K6_CANGL
MVLYHKSLLSLKLDAPRASKLYWSVCLYLQFLIFCLWSVFWNFDFYACGFCYEQFLDDSVTLLKETKKKAIRLRGRGHSILCSSSL